MAFLKELRRRSRASFRTSDSSKDSSENSIPSVPSQKSSSTLNSAYAGSTPPSSHPAEASNGNLSSSRSNVAPPPVPPIPTRPSMGGLTSNRNSMIVRFTTELVYVMLMLTGNVDIRICQRYASASTYFSIRSKDHFCAGWLHRSFENHRHCWRGQRASTESYRRELGCAT